MSERRDNQETSPDILEVEIEEIEQVVAPGVVWGN
jgi:hypothetical protein